MNSRCTCLCDGNDDEIYITEADGRYQAAIVTPIISCGEPIGSVIIVRNNSVQVDDETKYALTKTVAAFLGDSQ